MDFIVSKMIGFLIAPVNITLILCFSGLLLILTGGKHLGLISIFSGTLFLAAAVHTPLGNILILPLEERFQRPPLPANITGILCLGGGIESQTSIERDIVEQANASDRLYETAMLAKKYPEAKILYSGGSGKLLGSDYSSAEVAKRYFESLGIEPGRIWLESKSRNSYENVKLSYQLVAPKAGQTWIVVTSAFHMPRSIGLLRKAKWSILPWPVDYQTFGWAASGDFTNDGMSNLITTHLAIKEWVGLVSYFLLGRIDTPFPAPSNDDTS